MNWAEEIKNLNGWHFGGKGSGLEDELADLVRAGVKTATCSWYESYAVDNEPLPKVGDRSYIMDSNDKPICVLEITSVEIKPFLDVDADFAYAEGEGDRSYEYWRKAHEEFFKSSEKSLGLSWDPQTQSVVCERFQVLHIFD